MTPTIENVLKTAAKYIGYKEKKTGANQYLDSFTANAGSNNYTKFARDTKGYYGDKQGAEWCTTFINAVLLYTISGREDFTGATTASKEPFYQQMKEIQPFTKYGASCTYQTMAYKKAGRFFDTPRAGDQAFFTRGHTGLVESYDGKKLTIIEGNSHNQVERNVYNFPNAQFSGFGRPYYKEVSPDTKPAGNTHTVVPGDTPERIARKYGITPAELIAANIKKYPKMTIDFIRDGWVLDIPKASAPSFKPYYATVDATNGLNVRTGPGTSYQKIGVLKYGTKIRILEEKNGWGRHDYNGSAGWSALVYTR